ncbi:MAG: MutH/Sau3AI family endonuclease [Candidatus Paceibacterota bacterium]|jgi:DNA mismatch repair protein MutH
MSILNLAEIKTSQDLEKIAQHDLEGKTLQQIMASITASDSSTRVSTKAGVGYVIEEGYFGIGKNNTAGPDIPHLGVELKTSPLSLGKDGKLRVKEPLSLNIINYSEEYKKGNVTESSLYKKNKKVLFVWYIHDKNKLRSEYLIKYVFLWEMDSTVINEINDDYKMILDYIKKGEAHHIHQHQHTNLTLCPKHGGTFKDPSDRKSKTKQPFSDTPAEIRAFRLKNSYMNTVIRRWLLRDRPNKISEFISEKKPKTK